MRTSLQLLVGVSVLTTVSVADAKRPPNRPNEPQAQIAQLVDSDDGSLGDEDTKAAIDAQLKAPAMSARLLRCAPIGHRYTMAMIDLGKKRSRVIASGPDRKFTSCIEAALSTITGEGYAVVVQLSLSAPPDRSPEHYPQ